MSWTIWPACGECSLAGVAHVLRQAGGDGAARHHRDEEGAVVGRGVTVSVQGLHVRLDLVSPLGQTLAVVTSTPSGATLDLPNKPPRNAPEVDTLMEDALGFALPVAGLRDWLHGKATAGSPASATHDAQGRLATLAQNGWKVRYVDWQEPADRSTQPRRIDLDRAGDATPLSVRLVIDPAATPTTPASAADKPGAAQ